MNALIPPIKGIGERKSIHWSGCESAEVFFGFCNLRCPWCNARDLVLCANELPSIPVEKVHAELKDKFPGLPGVCVTGGEPAMHRGLIQFLSGLKDLGYFTSLETNGSQPHVLQYLIREKLVDAVLVDIKAPLDDEACSRAAGVYFPAELVKESLDAFMDSRFQPFLRTTVTPGFHEEEDLKKMAGQLKNMGFSSLNLHPFRPSGLLNPDLEKVKPFSPDAMSRMQNTVNAIFR